MRDWFSPQNSIWIGWLACWVFIGLLGAFFLLGVWASVRQIDLPMDYITPVQTLFYYIPFILFLLGVRGFALRHSDADLVKTINTLLLTSILEMALFYPYSFPRFLDPDFLTVLLVAVIPVLCINGILLLRLAEGFGKYVAELGTLGKRIIWWNKVAGWMFASVILILPGFVAASIGEFFLWRLLARETKHVTPQVRESVS